MMCKLFCILEQAFTQTLTMSRKEKNHDASGGIEFGKQAYAGSDEDSWVVP